MNAIYSEGDWMYVVDVMEEDDNRKNWHELYYKGKEVAAPGWFRNISPYQIATRAEFEQAVDEMRLKIWLTDGKNGAILNT